MQGALVNRTLTSMAQIGTVLGAMVLAGCVPGAYVYDLPPVPSYVGPYGLYTAPAPGYYGYSSYSTYYVDKHPRPVYYADRDRWRDDRWDGRRDDPRYDGRDRQHRGRDRNGGGGDHRGPDGPRGPGGPGAGPRGPAGPGAGPPADTPRVRPAPRTREPASEPGMNRRTTRGEPGARPPAPRGGKARPSEQREEN